MGIRRSVLAHAIAVGLAFEADQRQNEAFDWKAQDAAFSAANALNVEQLDRAREALSSALSAGDAPDEAAARLSQALGGTVPPLH